MLIDLHVHSNASDGTLSPSQVVRHAKEKGLSAIALTDHDTVDGLDEAIEAGASYDVEVLPGIELAADFAQSNLHILGLCIDHKNQDFIDQLRPLKDVRQIRNAKVLARLSSLGFNITIEEDSNIITRAHFARKLKEKGYVASMDEAFELYLNPGRPAYVKRSTPSPKQCIDLIHQAGGIAILAHPTLYKLNIEEVDKLARSLVEDGLDGIEAIYSLHSPEEELALKAIAEKYNLVISGGSDFHGSNKPGLELATGYGNLQIPYSILDAIRQYKKVLEN